VKFVLFDAYTTKSFVDPFKERVTFDVCAVAITEPPTEVITILLFAVVECALQAVVIREFEAVIDILSVTLSNTIEAFDPFACIATVPEDAYRFMLLLETWEILLQEETTKLLEDDKFIPADTACSLILLSATSTALLLKESNVNLSNPLFAENSKDAFD
jgi:hypothetical protein